MRGKIALEEHFAIPDTLQDSAMFVPDNHWSELRSRLLDMEQRRLDEMDTHGIEMMLLSLNAPAVQAIPDRAAAIDLARKANDHLAETSHRRPGRFQGLAALPMQDPDAAARELERCVSELGFRGALVNGFTQVDDSGSTAYYDLPQYRPFWATVQSLHVPFYLHPRNPLPAQAGIYEGHPWLLGPAWAFGHETAVHALRLMGSGLFDEYPALNIILGHMGEGLPYSIWRVDNHNAWMEGWKPYRSEHPLGHYFRRNFYLTTSGNFRNQTLIDAILEVSADRILFSADWPFENVDHAANWFDASTISELDREKIGRNNALELFRLDDVLTPTADMLPAFAAE